MQSRAFLGRFLRELLKTGLPLMKILIKLLAKRVLIPLELTAEDSVADAGIHKKIISSRTTTLIISNDEMEGIMKIVEDYGLLLKVVSETV